MGLDAYKAGLVLIAQPVMMALVASFSGRLSDRKNPRYLAAIVVMSSVDKKIYGTASAILATMRSTGMMFSMAIASLSMHLFLGNQKKNPTNMSDFMYSTRTVFIIFSILSFIGVFFSLAKRKVQNNPV